MDVLSTLLKTVKLEGAMFYNAVFSAPWSFRSPPSCLVAPYLSPAPRHVIIYHLLTHGQAYANIEDGQRIALSAGDIVVFPHGDSHLMGNGRDVEPKDNAKILQEIFSQGLKVASMGGRPEGVLGVAAGCVSERPNTKTTQQNRDPRRVIEMAKTDRLKSHRESSHQTNSRILRT